MKDKNSTFDGYVITRPKIARGASGVVHEATAPDGACVALKVLDRGIIEAGIKKKMAGRGASEEETREKSRAEYEKHIRLFKEEYQTLVGISHPHVAKVHQIGFFEGELYIAQEFIEGMPIAEFTFGKKPVDMIPFFIQTLEGLDFIHRSGLVHLDIKSANVLVDTSGDAPQVKIIDFGVAMSPVEYRGAFVGTRSYMAPEVVLGLVEEVDARADLFSMGVLMYACIARGSVPFARTKGDREALRRQVEAESLPYPPSETRAGGRDVVPEYLDTIVMRLLAKRPADRFYGNARAVINALTTRMPDAFRDAPDARASYLAPGGNRHIGRMEEQAMLLGALEDLCAGREACPSMFVIQGDHGMGRTHLLEKVKEAAQRHVEKIAISFIRFPANEAALDAWMRQLLRRLDENERPILILADDAHGAEGGAGEMLTGLVRRILDRSRNIESYRGTQPLMLCMSTLAAPEGGRAPLPAGLFGDPAVRVVRLNPFGRHEIREYLKSTPALKGMEISDRWVDLLMKRTGGIPREIRDHIEILNSRGILFGPEGSVIFAVEDPAHEKPPASTRERLRGLYSGLPRIEREILNLLAVWSFKGITRPATFDDLTGFFYTPAIAQGIKDLIANGFIEAQDGHLRWASDFFQQVVYEGIPPADREILHDGIAMHLKRDRDAVEFHAAFGSDRARALRSCLKLGRRMMMKLGRAGTACELVEHSTSLAPRDGRLLRIYITRLAVEAFYLNGRHKDAEGAFRDGIELVKSIERGRRGWEIALLLQIIPSYISERRYEDANDVIDMGLKLMRPGRTTPGFVSLLNYRARNYYEQSARIKEGAADLLREAKEIYERSEDLALSLPEAGRRACASGNYLGLILREFGRYGEARTALERKLTLEESDIFSSLTTMVALAETLRLMGDYDRAVDVARRLIEKSRQTASAKWMIYAHEVFANILHDADRFEDAIREAARALAAGSCLGADPEYRALSIRLWIQMGHCCKELKEWDRAVACFEAAIGAGAAGPYLMSANVGLAETYFHIGKYGAALGHAAYAEKLIEEQPPLVMRPYRFRVMRIRIESLFETGKAESARALLLELDEIAGDDPKLKGECKEVRAKYAS